MKIAFLSSFTIEPLIDFVVVESTVKDIMLDTYIGGYGQFNQQILDPSSGLYGFSPEITFLIIEFDSLINDQDLQQDTSQIAEKVVSQIASLAQAYKDNNSGILAIATFVAAPQWPMHIVASDKTKAIQHTNNLLQQTFADDSHIQIFDVNALAAYYGYSRAISAQMLHMARIPFSEGFMDLLAKKMLSHIKAYKGLVRKCLVVDCDNALWGGIIGEDGIDGISLGPDSPGREYLDLQKAILELYQQGIILAINSKNNLEDVMTVLNKHPHMLLQEKHFAAIEANWDDKPSNMHKIAKKLNIAIDSFVFLDDNPVEREMMRQMLPQIATVELPENPCLFSETLRQSNEFAKAYITSDDRLRGEIYAAQRKRSEAKDRAPSLDDFLESLNMEATIRLAEESDVKRVSQLTQRTNQFNLTTRRYSESDIDMMLVNNNTSVYVLGLKDKFGDNGTIGIAITVRTDNSLRIDTFLLSCRVIGRGAEDALVQWILANAQKDKIKTVHAEYISTAKNSLVAGFWEKMDFDVVEKSQDGSKWRFDISVFKPRKIKYLKVLDKK